MPLASPPQRTPRPHRAWYLDALSAVAFAALTIIGGKTLTRALGPIVALFYVVLTGGATYYFGKSAWRGHYGCFFGVSLLFSFIDTAPPYAA